MSFDKNTNEEIKENTIRNRIKRGKLPRFTREGRKWENSFSDKYIGTSVQPRGKLINRGSIAFVA